MVYVEIREVISILYTNCLRYFKGDLDNKFKHRVIEYKLV